MKLTVQEREQREKDKHFQASCRAAIKALQPVVKAAGKSDRVQQYEREYLVQLERERAERHAWECRGMVTV